MAAETLEALIETWRASEDHIRRNHPGDPLRLDPDTLSDCADELEAVLALCESPAAETPTDGEDQAELVPVLSDVCREADKDFERVGGSTRHWVRDCFLPALLRHRLRLMGAADDITICQHCREDIRPREWMDRETHSSCATGPNKNKPHAPVSGPLPAPPTSGAAQETKEAKR